jgi:hypothetical protein
MSYDHLGRRIRKTVSQNGAISSDSSFIYDGYLRIAA